MADAFEPRFADLVRIFSTTRGTDDFIIGAAVTGFRSFNAALEIGDRFYYSAIHVDRPSEREVGRGTLRADGKIAREPVGGNFTSFSPGTKTISLVAAAEWYGGIREQIAAAETTANDAAAAASASAAQVAGALTFTADSSSAVGRPFGAKLGDVVSVKDFGATGDGVTDDTAAMAAAVVHGTTTGQTIHVPPGTYLVSRTALRVEAVGASRFVLTGAGASSVIKLMDNQVTIEGAWMFLFRPQTSIDLIEVRDLMIDNNARGSPDPATTGTLDPFQFQQSHAFQVITAAGITVKTVRFSNVVIKDPAADGFRIAAPGSTDFGTVEQLVISNCQVIDRTRARSDIQFSTLPRHCTVTGFVGTVMEFENVEPVTERTILNYSNCTVERIDFWAGQNSVNVASPLIELNLDQVTTIARAAIGCVKLSATGCRLVVPTDDFRWHQLAAGSRVSNSRIVFPYDAGTNTIPSLNPTWGAGSKTSLLFDNCDFEIDSGDPAILPTGPMVWPVFSSAPTAAQVGDFRLVVQHCRFDPRCEISVNAYRAGTVKLFHNFYGGWNSAVRGGVSSGRAMDLTVDGGDFSRVTGAALAGGWLDVDQVTTINYYQLTGDWIGVATPLVNWASTPTAARNNSIISNRRMQMAALPASGLIGDVIDIRQPVEGKPDSYRCITSSGSAPVFRMRSQSGVRKDTTANRPALTASDAGTRYLDTTLAAAGKPVTWTGTAWVDSAGAAA